MTTHYEILEVSETASADAIGAAFRRLARTHHPDRGGAAERFQEIERAYSTLIDPDKRAAYDDSLAVSGTGPADGADDDPASEEPPEPGWGTERPVDPNPPRARPFPTTFPDAPHHRYAPPDPPPRSTPRPEPVPAAVRGWTAPPLPPPPGKPRRSRTVTVAGLVGLALYLVVLGTYVVTALSPLQGAGVPLAVTLLAAICLRRALSSRAGPWSLTSEIVVALPAVASAERVLRAPFAGWVALVTVGAMILAAELWRAGGRRARARDAAAWADYHHACRVKELAEHWQQMLLQAADPGRHLRRVVNAFPTGSKTNALLEDPRTGHRTSRWLWGRWAPGIWVVVDDRTDEVLHWAAAEARDAWDRIGARG